MEKDDNYSNDPMPPSFSSHHHHHSDLYNHHHHQDQFMRSRLLETSGETGTGILGYFPTNTPPPPPPPLQPITSLDKLSFAEVMQFADFGPKLSLNAQVNNNNNNNNFSEELNEESGGIDPVYFLKFPVLNEKSSEEGAGAGGGGGGEEITREELEEENYNRNVNGSKSNKRKRGRSVKTSEEVESQRMTHIAVERNRRKQMNEHLRVLRSLMPGSYVQRGDQASIIGGAIEFVRELEQLLQCLESQKRRRLLGEPPLQAGAELLQQPAPQQPAYLAPGAEGQMLETTAAAAGLLREEAAESKSCLADVEVKVLGLDAMIKILSRRRPGQLIKAIAALEDLQLNILHTNITTIEQTVLYSFNVKIASESRFTAEDIATSVQQIFSFIHANTSM